MSSTHTCPQCGTALPAGTPPWVCPQCLLGQATAVEPSEATGSSEATSAVTASVGPLGRPSPFRLGAYELIERIGQGGMGVVYKARQISLDRDVAVKVLSLAALAGPEAVHRFRTEAVTAGSLQHPNIVAVHEVGLAEGQHYLVMDYVPGPTLTDLTRNGPLPGRRAAQYLRTIAEAVHFAHERGILHRDLKPSNVLIDGDDQPRVTDFGLAKRLVDAQLATPGSQVTLTGQVLGSPAFIPPEQASGQRGRVGRRSDVYALGAILYQLLTGRPPFVGEVLADTLRQVLNEEPPGPRLLNPKVPLELETVCLKCLEKEPDRRYPTAQALAEELGRFLENRPILAHPTGFAGKVWRWCRRNPRFAGAMGAAMVSLVLGLAGTTWQWRQAAAERARAEAEGLLARRQAYAADMNQAQRALQDDDLGQVQRRLATYQLGSGLEHLRGFEWRYLAAQCRSDALVTEAAKSSKVFSLDLSSDSRTLAAGWRNGWVELYDAGTLKRTAALETNGPYQGTDFSSAAVAFAPAGDILAAGAGPHLIRLWRWSSREVVGELANTNADTAICLSFSPDGNRLAVFYWVGGVCIWDLQARQILWQNRGFRSEGEASGEVAFSPDGGFLAVGDRSGHIRLMDSAAGRTVWDVPAHDAFITCLAYSADGRWLASGCGYHSGTIRLWEAATGKSVAALEGHRPFVHALQFSPDGRRLFSASLDQTLRIWDIAQARIATVLRGHQAAVSAMCLSADGGTLVSGDYGGTLCRWPTETSGRRSGYVQPAGKFRVPVFVDEGTTLAGLDDRGAVVLWDCRVPQPPRVIEALGTNNVNLAAVPAQGLLACGDGVGQVQLCWLRQSTQVRRLTGLSNWVTLLEFFKDGRGLVARDRTAQTVVWDTITLSKVAAFRTDDNVTMSDEGLSSGAVSPDGSLLVLGLLDGRLAWWDLARGTKLAGTPAHRSHVFAVAFSPDGRLMATSGDDDTLAVWPAEIAGQPTRWRHNRSGCFAVAFSRVGNRLATGDGTTGLRLWDLETLRELLDLPGEGSLFRHAEWSMDGNAILTATSDGRCCIWRAPSSAELDGPERTLEKPR